MEIKEPRDLLTKTRIETEEWFKKIDKEIYGVKE